MDNSLSFRLWRNESAERVGFEPTMPIRAYRFSRPAPSTTRTPLHHQLFNHLAATGGFVVLFPFHRLCPTLTCLPMQQFPRSLPPGRTYPSCIVLAQSTVNIVRLADIRPTSPRIHQDVNHKFHPAPSIRFVSSRLWREETSETSSSPSRWRDGQDGPLGHLS